MAKVEVIRPVFVSAIPERLEPGILYISKEYATAVHNCCCGCGKEVVTPLGATDWHVTVTGNAVTVYPSIGNWSFPCRSHYWIERGRVCWSEQWSQARIDYGRSRDRIAKQRQYGEAPEAHMPPQQPPRSGTGFWASLWRFITGR